RSERIEYMETHKNFTDNPSSKASSSGRNNRPWDRPWDRRDKEELRTLSDQSANLVTSEADTGSLAEFLERQAKRRTHDELSSSGSEIGDLSIKKIKTGEDEKTAKEQLSSIERDITKINAHDNINL